MDKCLAAKGLQSFSVGEHKVFVAMNTHECTAFAIRERLQIPFKQRAGGGSMFASCAAYCIYRSTNTDDAIAHVRGIWREYSQSGNTFSRYEATS